MLPRVPDPAPRPPRAVLLGVQLPDASDDDFASSVGELRRLARTLGIEVVGQVAQRRSRLSPGSVVGAGKLQELAAFTGGSGRVPQGPPGSRRRSDDPDDDEPVGEGGEDEEREEREEREEGEEIDDTRKASGGGDNDNESGPRADTVLVDHDLSPSQLRNLERATGATVLDRTGVILAIFQRHARSREARLQVEIARLNYLTPRLRETGGGKDRQGGGIGRSSGESNLEMDRRKVRDRIAELRLELAEIERTSGTRRKRRSDQARAALVGYTNAGKSSWMRALTGSGVLVRDELFATLDTTVRTLQPESVPRVLVSDTVGFIKKLPHDLVASFRSTLDEARECDLLVHVVDASDPAFSTQMEVTNSLLAEIGAGDRPRLLVLNKADRLPPADRERLASEWPEALVLSVRDPADVARLHARIVGFFEQDMVEDEVVVPYARQRWVSEAYSTCQVLAESHDESGTHLRLRAKPDAIARLRAGVEGA